MECNGIVTQLDARRGHGEAFVNEQHATKRGKVSSIFAAVAVRTSQQCGRASTFILACTAILVWAVTGPVFGYSDTWQLVINTGTTIITFLMVFLIQNTQNRDMAALHLKLDELIRVSEVAHNKLLNLEDLTEEELEQLKDNFTRLAKGGVDTDQPRDAKREPSKAEDTIADAREPVGAVADSTVSGPTKAR
jgi:low affinity Fe/Cu permease